MGMLRQVPGVVDVSIGEFMRTMVGPGAWGASMQVNISGGLTVAVEGSLDAGNWIQLSGDLTSTTIVNLTQTGPIAYLRLRGKAGTGSASGILMELH